MEPTRGANRRPTEGMNMKKQVLVPLAAGAALVAGAAQAHHSGAMFDASKTVTLDGTVKEFQWINPHVWIILETRDADGKVVEWNIEGASPAQLSKRGWKKSVMKPGDKINVVSHPVKSGKPEGNMVKVTVNGKVIGEQG
jgi:hypothetical protein